MESEKSLNVEDYFNGSDPLNEEILARSKDAILSMAIREIAHQFSTPISIVMLATGQLQDRFSAHIPEDQIDKYSTLIKKTEKATEKLNRLVESLRTTHCEEYISGSPSLVDIQEYLKSLLSKESFRTLLVDQNISWDLPDSVHVSICEKSFPFLIYCLLENAVRANSITGTLEIKLSAGLDANEQAFLSIQDKGPGIPEEQMHEAGEPFVRLENFLVFPGQGLGLSFLNSYCKLNALSYKTENSEEGLRLNLLWPEGS